MGLRKWNAPGGGATPLVGKLELHQMPEECYEPAALFMRFPHAGDAGLVNAFASVYTTEQVKALGGSDLGAAVHGYRVHSYFEQHLFRLVHGVMPFGFHQHTRRRLRYVTALRDPVDRLVSELGEGVEPPERLATQALDNPYTRNLNGPEAMALPVGALTDRHLERARSNLITFFAGVGVSENPVRTLECWCERFGWPRLPVIPRAARPDRAIADDDRARLEKLLAYDYEIYGLAKELVGGYMPIPKNDPAPDLSMVFGTYNRIHHLVRCIASLRKAMGHLTYELVVCDAGSTDGTREWLASQPDVVLLGEHVREGAVAAFNKGFRLARGKAIAYWNDDVVAVDERALESALIELYKPGVGQVACPFNIRDAKTYASDHVHGIIYANLGIVTRPLAEAIVRITGGLWSPCYRTYGADTELSCWVSKLGFRVVQVDTARFTDQRVDDDLRAYNKKRATEDSALFWKRWPNPEMVRPDGPDPHVSAGEIARYREVLAHGISIVRGDPRPPESPRPPSEDPAEPPPLEEISAPGNVRLASAERAKASGAHHERVDSQTVKIRNGVVVAETD